MLPVTVTPYAFWLLATPSASISARGTYEGNRYKQKNPLTETGVKKKKKWQATYIAPLQPHTFAVFPPWRSLQELVV